MQYKDRIDALSDRAVAIHMSLWLVCRRAHVDYSTVYRWREGRTSPNVDSLDRVLGAIDRELQGLEKALVDHVHAAGAPRPAA